MARGELELNEPLPAELELAREYGVSLGTARAATAVLREHGVVFTLPCKGTFVVKKVTEQEAAEIGNWKLDLEPRQSTVR